MTTTKEQQAQEYVLNRQTARHNAKTEEEATMADFDKTRKVWDAYDMEQAFEDGYTAAEQSMWRSVDDELPEENQTALCRIDDGEYIVARFGHMDVYNDDAGGLYADPEWWVENGCESYTLGSEITHWMPIPSLPEANTEKR